MSECLMQSVPVVCLLNFASLFSLVWGLRSEQRGQLHTSESGLSSTFWGIKNHKLKTGSESFFNIHIVQYLYLYTCNVISRFYAFLTDVLCALWTCGPCVKDDLSGRTACNCRGTQTNHSTLAPKKVFAPIQPLLGTAVTSWGLNESAEGCESGAVAYCPHLATILNKTRKEKLINICLDSSQYWCVYMVIWEVYYVGSL